MKEQIYSLMKMISEFVCLKYIAKGRSFSFLIIYHQRPKSLISLFGLNDLNELDVYFLLLKISNRGSFEKAAT
jgi:hypothetical protein